MEKKKTTKKIPIKEKAASKKTVNPVRTGASRLAAGGITPPSAISLLTADPLRRSFSEASPLRRSFSPASTRLGEAGEASRSRRRSNGVKAGGAKKTLPRKEEAVVEVEMDAATASKKPVALEGRVPPNTIGPVTEAIISGESRLGALGRERYFEAVGRRKTAVARVRLFTKAGDFMVNKKLHSVYFSTLELLRISEDALQKMKLFGRFKVTAEIKGGGMHAQAEALRQGLSRCLVKFNPDFRKRLRRADFLKRDPRMKERKKPGLKRARKAPQWQKR